MGNLDSTLSLQPKLVLLLSTRELENFRKEGAKRKGFFLSTEEVLDVLITYVKVIQQKV